MLSWGKFTGRSDISGLDINEQKRLYYVYQNDYYWKASMISGRKGVVVSSGSFLLQENGFYLLQENSSKIKL
jgi:hypothetical protein